MLEVHTRERPARPAVGVVISAALLLGVVVLAAVFSQQRRQISFSEPIDVPGWSIKFRMPAGWIAESNESSGDTSSVEFSDPADEERHERISVIRGTGLSTTDPQSLATEILQHEFLGGRISVGSRVPQPARMPLGPLPGARVILDGWRLMHRREVAIRSLILHVGVVSQDECYVLRLDSDAPLRARDTAILDQVASSIQTVTSIADFRPSEGEPSGAAGASAGNLGGLIGLR